MAVIIVPNSAAYYTVLATYTEQALTILAGSYIQKASLQWLKKKYNSTWANYAFHQDKK
jgi:hypothetical protein